MNPLCVRRRAQTAACRLMRSTGGVRPGSGYEALAHEKRAGVGPSGRLRHARSKPRATTGNRQRAGSGRRCEPERGRCGNGSGDRAESRNEDGEYFAFDGRGRRRRGINGRVDVGSTAALSVRRGRDRWRSPRRSRRGGRSTRGPGRSRTDRAAGSPSGRNAVGAEIQAAGRDVALADRGLVSRDPDAQPSAIVERVRRIEGAADHRVQRAPRACAGGTSSGSARRSAICASNWNAPQR